MTERSVTPFRAQEGTARESSALREAKENETRAGGRKVVAGVAGRDGEEGGLEDAVRGHPRRVQGAVGRVVPSEGAPYRKRRGTASSSESPRDSRNTRRLSVGMRGRTGRGGKSQGKSSES